MKKIVLGLLALTAFIFSCKKNDSTTQNLLLGKWTYVKDVEWYTPAGSPTQKDTTLAHTGEYIDFRTDGKVYGHYWDNISFQNDTADYTVNGNNLIVKYAVSPGVFSSDTSDLQTLSSSNLTLHYKAVKSTYTDEVWDFYTK